MESAEHVWIGDSITVEFDAGRVSAKGLSLRVSRWRTSGPVSAISYGQLIALGGDFYGIPDRPICEARTPENGFFDAWASLADSLDFLPGLTQLAAILSTMKEEVDAVAEAVKKGIPPSTVYAQFGDRLSIRWTSVTAFRYVRLALHNFDHFGDNAVKAYNAGHRVARSEAVRASQATDRDERRARLERAYAMNAFACHFLTDLFSSGHLRVPRVPLYYKSGDAVLNGRLVRAMHDEDSYHGLTVQNASGETWKAFGDKRLLDTESARNLKIVVQATQRSADGVWNAYKTGNTDGPDTALDLIPQLTSITTPPNDYPLFKEIPPKRLVRRKNLNNPMDKEIIEDWTAWDTYYDLVEGHTLPYQNVECYDLETNKFLGWMGGAPALEPRLVIVPDESQAHGVAWNFSRQKLYLEKATTPKPRWLGWWSGDVAGWSLAGGQYRPVVYNADGTLSLADEPKRKLYASIMVDGTWATIKWSDGTDKANRYLIRFVLPLPDPNS